MSTAPRSSRPRRMRLSAGVVLAVAAVLAAGGCTGAGPTAADGPGTPGASSVGGGAGSSSATSTHTPRPAELVVSPLDRATGVTPDTPITVRASVGSVTSVVVTDDKGKAVPMAKQADSSYASTARLRPSASYTVVTTAVGPDGDASTDTRTFSTLKPKVIATYGINYSGMTVGVGMPVSIQFDSQVTTKDFRAAVEKAVKLQVTPAQEGSWGWLDNRQLMWRPKNYWLPGTTVRVETPFTGLQTGPDKWVGSDDSGGFTVGAATISYVDIAKHTMTVTQNGKTIRTLPISAGQDKMPYITRSGTKVIIEKLPTVIMDSATSGIPKGDPEYYREKVDWDLRVTWTGEYLHSAPWSVAAQGNANVSHGCVNIAPAAAKWMYDLSKVGDVVKFTGSNRPFLPTEGIGVWQYDFASWQKQSALAG